MTDRIALLKDFEQIAHHAIAPVEVVLCRDPKDDKFLSLALSNHSECIISGDQDLLVLSGAFPIPILTAAQFLQRQ